MKTIRKTLLLFAIVLVSGSVMASGDMNVNLIPVQNNKALVAINSTAQNRFEIQIENDNGDVIYYHNVKSPTENYEKIYDLQDLENGNYRFLVSDNNEQVERTVNLRNGEISVTNKEKDMAPYFSFNNGNLKLSYLNFDRADVHLYLYNNENDERVYKADLGSDFSINSGLNLSKLKPGSYEAVLASEDHVHSYDIDID